ncbi:MAG TPA: PilZ domain-containing protein [Nitrospira sp.]|nr:PilZ domain-containing protein [Nitrospira sp.]
MTIDENMGDACRSDADDKRKYPRFCVAFPVSLGDGVFAQAGMVVDISHEGCRIRSTGGVPGVKYFQVEIHLEGPAERMTVDLAVMRWSRPEEFGIEFIRMAPKCQAQLRRIIRNCEEATATAGGDEDLRQPCSEAGRRAPHDGRP